MSKYPRLAGINYESVVDGPGVRAAIYLSGCDHNCQCCHNPETHDPSFGKILDEQSIKDIASKIKSMNNLSGITITGGDPLFDVDMLASFMMDLLRGLDTPINIWLYTGFTWDDIISKQHDEAVWYILLKTSVLVDGEYIQNLADRRLAFRGSSNQRIIDVQASLSSGDVVTLDFDHR